MKYPGENYDKPWTEEGDFGPKYIYSSKIQ